MRVPKWNELRHRKIRKTTKTLSLKFWTGFQFQNFTRAKIENWKTRLGVIEEEDMFLKNRTYAIFCRCIHECYRFFLFWVRNIFRKLKNQFDERKHYRDLKTFCFFNLSWRSIKVMIARQMYLSLKSITMEV